MADNDLENVRFFVKGGEFTVSQLGIDLIQQSSNDTDPIIEAVVISRRRSGLIETETSLIEVDTMAKLAEHLTLRSSFESAQSNSCIAYEDEGDEDND